jgi:hypothetical protein
VKINWPYPLPISKDVDCPETDRLFGQGEGAMGKICCDLGSIKVVDGTNYN